MEATSIGGDAPPGQPPGEKKWSESELALIHAAMMEELGVGRKDTLPLDDKGVNIRVSKPIKREVADDPNDPTARWRNIQFDDVDPAEAELDTMYDGQLYRLRKQALGGSPQHGFPSRGGHGPGRGRGASRGGHTGRGGSGRGGYDPHMGRRNGIPNVPPHLSGCTPKTFFNDARRGANNHARIDNFIVSLRTQALDYEKRRDAEAQQVNTKRIEQQRQIVAAKAAPTRRPPPASAKPQFTLASEDAFLAYAGFNKAIAPKSTPSKAPLAAQQPLRPTSPAVTSKEFHEVPTGQAKVRLPQSPQVADNVKVQHKVAQEKNNAIHDIVAKESRPATVQAGEVGLSGSRWAETSSDAVETLSMTAAPASLALQPNTLATIGRTVLRENQVKISRGSSSNEIRGHARLVEHDRHDETYFAIELEVADKTILNQEVLESDKLAVKESTLEYETKMVDEKSGEISTRTWNIKFQMPYQSLSFYNTISSRAHTRHRREAAGQAIPESAIDALSQSTSSRRVAASNRKSDHDHGQIKVPKIRGSSSWKDNENLPVDNAHPQFSRAGQPLSAINNETSSVGSTLHLELLDKSPVLLESTVQPGSAQQIPSAEWLVMQPIVDNTSAGLLDRFQPGGAHRISSHTWTDMTEVAGQEPLVSFADVEPEPKAEPLHPYVQMLLSMDDTQLLNSLFNHFEYQPQGNILDQLSRIVAKDNIPPAAQLSAEQILSSPKYQEAAESLVGGYLCYSETFAMMPDMLTIQYTMEKARKLLFRAIAQRKIERDASRITYSPEDLLSLRSNASIFKSEIISREVAQLIVRVLVVPKPVNPANVIRTTKNGIPIVAGRDHARRQSTRSTIADQFPERPAPVKHTPPVNSEQLMSPRKPANTVQTQESDMALLGALLTAVRDNTQDLSRIRAAPNTHVQPLSQASSGGSKHVPTNSECDGLATTLGELHLAKNMEEETPVSKAQSIATSDVNVDANHPPPKGPNSSTSSAAMYEKIRDALKSPLAMSSHRQSTASSTPTPSYTKMAKSEDNSIPPPPALPPTTSAPEVKTEGAQGTELSLCPDSQDMQHAYPPHLHSLPMIGHGGPAMVSANLSPPESSVKVEKQEVSTSCAQSQIPEKVETSTTAPEVRQKIANNAEPSPTPTMIPVTGSMVESTSLKSEVPAAAEPIAPAALLPEISNKDLKGAPGLKASKWASGPTTAPQSPSTRARIPPVTGFKPIYPVPPQYNDSFAQAQVSSPFVPRNAPSQTPTFMPRGFENVFAPPPLPVMTSYPPEMQTILVPDPLYPGGMRPVTGIATDQPAHPFTQPMASMMNHHTKQENVPYNQQAAPMSSFAPAGSDLTFKTSGQPVTPSRGRGDTILSPPSRAALSPVRRGEDVQAKLQSRLNSSLAGRSSGDHHG